MTKLDVHIPQGRNPMQDAMDALKRFGCEDANVSVDLAQQTVRMSAIYKGQTYKAEAKGYAPLEAISWCVHSIRKMILRQTDWREVHGWRGEDS